MYNSSMLGQQFCVLYTNSTISHLLPGLTRKRWSA